MHINRDKDIDRGKTGARGFSLLELLWVVLILSIIFCTSRPYFSGVFLQMALENKAREVFMAFTYLQQQALNRQEIFGLSFDLTEGQQVVTCYKKKGCDVRTSEPSSEPLIDANNILPNPLTKKPYLIKLDEGEQMLIDETEFGGKHWVEFDVQGKPSKKGCVTLARDGLSYMIEVSHIGRLSFISQ